MTDTTSAASTTLKLEAELRRKLLDLSADMTNLAKRIQDELPEDEGSADEGQSRLHELFRAARKVDGFAVLVRTELNMNDLVGVKTDKPALKLV